MSWIKKLFGVCDDGGQPSLLPETSFVYVRMPGDVQPVERHHLFEDPIEHQLKINNLGYVSGGGTLQSAPDEDGCCTIELTGIDIEAKDLDAVRALLRDLLPGLGAPIGTQIEFTIADRPLQDRLSDDGWVKDEARSDLHPGFGI